MIALFDVNVLVALFDAAHVHHARAHAWLAENRARGWATCPITQNGCLRVLSQPRYPGHLPVAEVARRLRNAIATSDHTFWPDSISICDPQRFEHQAILTPKPLTDLYLLALAVERGGRLVTMDRTIPVETVPKARSKHLLVL